MRKLIRLPLRKTGNSIEYVSFTDPLAFVDYLNRNNIVEGLEIEDVPQFNVSALDWWLGCVAYDQPHLDAWGYADDEASSSVPLGDAIFGRESMIDSFVAYNVYYKTSQRSSLHGSLVAFINKVTSPQFKAAPWGDAYTLVPDRYGCIEWLKHGLDIGTIVPMTDPERERLERDIEGLEYPDSDSDTDTL